MILPQIIEDLGYQGLQRYPQATLAPKRDRQESRKRSDCKYDWTSQTELLVKMIGGRRSLPFAPLEGGANSMDLSKNRTPQEQE